jgi:hypothetical protein
MKNFFRAIGYAAGTAIGFLLGKWLWDAITNPANRAKAKKKLKNVKDAISREED